MKIVFLSIVNVALICAVLFLSGCNDVGPKDQQKENISTTSTPASVAFTAEEIIEENKTPTVDIAKYTLVSSAGEKRKEDAAKVLQLKRRWPLAMQSLDKNEFESILARDFTFTDAGKMMNREEYISDRTTEDAWKITHVVYDNMTLQFFGEVAVLSYRNRVTNDHSKTKEREIEIIHWVDVYKKESNEWKLAAAQVVDFKIEPN
ncbi:MAG: nuclear transport factor 2 family protein [Acidobacteria bacterium]|nr:nuclear transport factor 2 family protein [Acidobacteriota bacterium]